MPNIYLHMYTHVIYMCTYIHIYIYPSYAIRLRQDKCLRHFDPALWTLTTFVVLAPWSSLHLFRRGWGRPSMHLSDGTGALNLSNVNFGSRNWKGSHRPSMSIRYILGDARFKNGRWTPPSKHLPKTTFRAKQFWHSNTSLCYISICTNIRRLVTFFDAAFLFRSFLPTTILGSLVQNCQGWYFD